MNRWVIVGMLSMIGVIAHAGEFRKVDFGATLKDVKKAETAEMVLQESNRLVYYVSVTEKDALAIYYFTDEVCYGGGYLFMEKYNEPQDYIDDYYAMKTNLITLYGEPDEDNLIWYTDLFKDQPDFYGLAVESDWLAFQSKWNTNEISILMTLKGDGDRIFLSVYYEDDQLGGETAESYQWMLLEDL